MESLWHITVLSNFARGYDKYTRHYSKELIAESTYPSQFFLLHEVAIDIGIHKARLLLKKVNLPGDRLIALNTNLSSDLLRPNLKTGLGEFIEGGSIYIDQVFILESIDDFRDGKLYADPLPAEEVMALSLKLHHEKLHRYEDIKPRTVSVLPIAKGCQASCPFCFSEASASLEQKQGKLDFTILEKLTLLAKERGAERFVITGGGEPGLLSHSSLEELISIGNKAFGKVVIITNAHHLAEQSSEKRSETILDYASAGLGVLAISRHHYDDVVCERLMSLHTDVGGVINTWKAGQSQWQNLRLRLVCVLQKGCVDSLAEIVGYVEWATLQGVEEICFKELYVTSSIESVFYQRESNEWSYANQVPLSLVIEFFKKHDFVEVARLPWGAPVFSGEWKGRPVRIAAYTEPSLFWERTHGIGRSWNVMADGRCLVSLEDRESEILKNELHDL